MKLQFDYINQRKVKRTTMLNGSSKALYECMRCDGSGYLSHYRHVEGGICFRCKGKGKTSYPDLYASAYKQAVNHSSLVKNPSPSSRWYLGLWIENSQHQILFDFTSNSTSHAQDRAETLLKEKGVCTDSATHHFKLVSGAVGEKKADLILRLQSLI